MSNAGAGTDTTVNSGAAAAEQIAEEENEEADGEQDVSMEYLESLLNSNNFDAMLQTDSSNDLFDVLIHDF